MKKIWINRDMNTYLRKGYTPEWVNLRLKSIEIRKDLTDEWQKRRVKKADEFAVLTDEITEAWAGSISAILAHGGRLVIDIWYTRGYTLVYHELCSSDD